MYLLHHMHKMGMRKWFTLHSLYSSHRMLISFIYVYLSVSFSRSIVYFNHLRKVYMALCVHTFKHKVGENSFEYFVLFFSRFSFVSFFIIIKEFWSIGFVMRLTLATDSGAHLNHSQNTHPHTSTHSSRRFEHLCQHHNNNN